MTLAKLLSLALALSAAALVPGCALDGMGSGSPRAACDICTPANMSGSGFALPQNGVVIYQGTVKVFDLDRRTFSFIETEPPLARPHEAKIVARRDLTMSEAELAWVSRMTELAWAPPAAKTAHACATKDGRLPAMVVLINQSGGQAKFFAEYECGPEDASGQLSELTARADRFVAQRYANVTPK
jgi:hypothetical protein